MKSHKSPHASWLGTTRSADASPKYLFIFTKFYCQHIPKVVGEKGTYIRWRDGVSVPWDTKHAVAAGLDDEVVSALGTRGGRDDVFDATVSTIATCYSCKNRVW